MKFIGIQVLISLCLGSDAITKGNGSEEQLQELKIAMPKVQTNRVCV